MNESVISGIPLLAALPPEEVQRLSLSLRTVEVPAGTVLVREGGQGESFYVVLSGEIEIVKAMGTTDERLIGVRGAGEYLGEMSLLNPDGKRTASIRARTPVQALEMTRDELHALLHRHPSMAYEMTRVLSDRLTSAHNVAIADLQEKNRQLQAAYEELKAAQAQLVEKERLERELQVAREIQESMLPRERPELPGLDFGARMVPTRAVGGDFFDFVVLDETHVGIAIADVSGKGTPAAMFMALSRSLLRAEAWRSRSPGEVLRNVNRLLLEMNESGMFVTMVYGVLDAATLEFHYARAGHDAPLVFGPSGPGRALEGQRAMPLAVLPESPLDVQRLRLSPGDLLLLFTDGITEAEEERQELFGPERLNEAVASWHGIPAQEVCDRMVEVVGAYRGAAPQSDDLTIVAVRVGAGGG